MTRRTFGLKHKISRTLISQSKSQDRQRASKPKHREEEPAVLFDENFSLKFRAEQMGIM